jgi:predicted ATP-grasp superfamily ATP-dependent carboligase
MNVLLTDGNFKHTLAAVRALGKQGINTTVLSHIPGSLSFLSKYCTKSVHAPNPEKDVSFPYFVLEFVKNNHIDVILPISFASVMQLNSIRGDLERYTKIPLASNYSLNIAGDKHKTLKFADALGIRIPKTWYPTDENEVKKLSTELSYPIVIKGISDWGVIHYANNSYELIKYYHLLKEHTPVLQEYIIGDGYGFFALYNHGKHKAIFMHKRIREYPVTGGPSAMAISIYDEKLFESGKTILDALNWHGVAMVEYKKDSKTGEFVLMEINPKFWGSLGLAIDSGVNFPYLTCEMEMHGDINPVLTYQQNLIYRWLFPADIFNVITQPSNFRQFIRDFKNSDIYYDIDITDIKPTIMQIGMTVAELALKLKQHKFWRPHGFPIY